MLVAQAVLIEEGGGRPAFIQATRVLIHTSVDPSALALLSQVCYCIVLLEIVAI